MAIDRRKLALYIAALAIRLLLSTAFPLVTELLTGRVEISTPVTSYKRREYPQSATKIKYPLTTLCEKVQEGLYLYTHHVSPYDGGVFHQAPLLLPLFALLPKQRVVTHLLYIVLDLLSANALMSIADTGESSSSKLFTSPRRGARWSSVAVGAAWVPVKMLLRKHHC